MIGTTFAGFTVHERVNRGGTADIYMVTDRNDRPFALRVLLPGYRFSWGRIWRFNHGCKVLSLLDHPHVIGYYGRGKERGLRYAVLEWVDGPNLREKILRTDPQLMPHLLRVLTGMAAALAHVHERGFIHLDFKPENVLVPRSFEPKLVDFDLARPRPARAQRLPTLSGTPAYLAPEQLAREPVDERADVFAFGVTAYEVITGKKPINANTQDEMLKKYANFNEHLVPLRSRVPGVPPQVDRVISKCLEKDVERRYPSMHLVLRDLQS
jgi:serine/threonine-protein kinase